jgi:hypothetical protein
MNRRREAGPTIRPRVAPARSRVDCAAVPVGLAVLGAARLGAQALDDRWELDGRLAAVPMAAPGDRARWSRAA